MNNDYNNWRQSRSFSFTHNVTGLGKNGPGKNGPGKNGPEKTVRGIIGLVVKSVKTVRSFR